MTPNEKAKELVDTFYQTTPNETWIDEPLGEFMETYTAWGQSTQCALIAVNEIIDILELNGFTLQEYHDKGTLEYWLLVKDEIQKL